MSNPRPSLAVSASGTLLNPWYSVPSIWSYPNIAREPAVGVDAACRVELPLHLLSVRFVENTIVFTPGHWLATPLVYFVTYRTFTNYRLWSFHVDRDEDVCPPAESISFKTERLVRVDRQVGPVTHSNFESKPETLQLAASEITRFVEILDGTLHYALSSYLTGCDNPRYFLVEFYKAVEAVRFALGGERAMLTKLGPHGVRRGDLKAFTRACNDTTLAPIDIARHAPEPGVPMDAVDLRNFWVEPRSRDLFEAATTLCRRVIDAYISLRSQRPK